MRLFQHQKTTVEKREKTGRHERLLACQRFRRIVRGMQMLCMFKLQKAESEKINAAAKAKVLEKQLADAHASVDNHLSIAEYTEP